MMQKLKRTFGFLLAIAILFFLGRMLVQTWGELAASGFRFEFDLLRLGISLILIVVARGFAVEAWRRILFSLNEHFSFGFGARVWFLSNLTRYVPGNIWQVATMMAMVQAKGVSLTNALLSQVIYTAIALSVAGFLGVMYIFARPEILNGIFDSSITTYAPIIIALGFIALIIFFALPPINRFIIAITARIMRRQVSAPTPTFTRGLVPPLLLLGKWLVEGIGFFWFVDSVTLITPAMMPVFIAMNAGAYWVGYVSFITPSGLGFREGALAWMLTGFMPTPVAVALSLATRLWSTIGELLGVVLIWIIPAEKTQ